MDINLASSTNEVKVIENSKEVGRRSSGKILNRSLHMGSRGLNKNLAGANAGLNSSLSVSTVQADDFILDRAALQLASEMRTDKSIILKERRYMFKTYKSTFYHSQGLAWLMNKVAEYEEEKATKKGSDPYKRSEDDLLEWKAMAVGNRLRDAGYLVQISGKHGFKAHRKKNHLFRYHDKNIDRDLAKPAFTTVTPEEMEAQRKSLFTQRHCLGDF